MGHINKFNDGWGHCSVDNHVDLGRIRLKITKQGINIKCDSCISWILISSRIIIDIVDEFNFHIKKCKRDKKENKWVKNIK